MSERYAVQNPLLKYATQMGWKYVKPKEALRRRGGDKGLYFTDILEAQLFRLNPGVIDMTLATEIIRKLNFLNPTIEGNREALSWLRGEQSIFVPAEKRERNIWLIDFGNPDNNLFQITDEWPQQGASFRNRADIFFLINGIPVAVAETKSASRPDGLSEGVEQIRRYHQETPEMFISSQVFEVTQLLDFYYGATWSTNRKNIFNWKEEEPGNFERKIKTFFERTRFLKALKDYISFLTINDELAKVILRQHQTAAVEKVIERVYNPKKRRGLIWHTQGSGKTLTMITIASKLLRDTTEAEKPTILMLVDRNELEGQLFKNLVGYGISNFKTATSKRDLQEILVSDYRGLIISMIHKFDGIPVNINKRDSIIVLVDEAHRTTGGDLGNYLMAALPNATYIGFTGTPIDNLSKGKGTFKVFGSDDKEGYLHKYSIAESIEDGTTVKLNYDLAPSSLMVDRKTLEQKFLNLAEAEGMSDVEELNAILDRAVELKEMMKSPERIAKIAALVAQHFKENVEPMGFKAFLVAVDREACALYKKELDKHLLPKYSRVVYSPAHNDEQLLKEFYMSEDEEKKVRKDFLKRDKLPKILIVTEKLLTGYDAPILYCMYLDKPMRDHVLLQAIARVNRPYEDENGLVKPFGFVLDFVGIFEKLEKALAFDSDIVASVIQNIDVLKNLFSTLMQNEGQKYLPLTHGKDDKAKEKTIEYFSSKEKREEFFKNFKQLESLYEILSPDAFLGPYIEEYKLLAELYGLIRNAYTERVYVDKEFTRKTSLLLRKATGAGTYQFPGEIHELGPEELSKLKQSGASDTSKVLSLRKVLAKAVVEQGQSKPFLLSIGERAELLAQAYEDRQLTTQQALGKFEQLAQECVEAEKERQQLGIDENTFAIYTTLKSAVPYVPVENAQSLNVLFDLHPDFQWNEQQKAKLRAELYKILLPSVGEEKMIEIANSILNLRRV